MKLVTIVAEALARPAIEQLVNQVGAHGFTVFPVEGSGAGGERRADMGEYSNVQFEVIVPPAIAQTLMDRLYTDYMPRYGLVVFEGDVRVLRPDKF
jgi:nitrogen regulatory protein PII